MMVTPCQDLDPCTQDSCDPQSGCVHQPAADCGSCQDVAECPLAAVGQCVVVTCEAGHCTYAAAQDGTPCSDSDACTAGDACAAGQCSGTRVSCDDANQCTTDVCDPANGQCSNVPIAGCGPCDDASQCDDLNPCTTD